MIALHIAPCVIEIIRTRAEDLNIILKRLICNYKNIAAKTEKIISLISRNIENSK